MTVFASRHSSLKQFVICYYFYRWIQPLFCCKINSCTKMCIDDNCKLSTLAKKSVIRQFCECRSVFSRQTSIMTDRFSKNSLRLKAIHDFLKKLHHKCLARQDPVKHLRWSFLEICVCSALRKLSLIIEKMFH